MPASLLCAAPRIPAITAEETANACAISQAEWGRWQPNPKYRRITFSCRGGSLRRISDMRFRSIGATSFQNNPLDSLPPSAPFRNSKTESTLSRIWAPDGLDRRSASLGKTSDGRGCQPGPPLAARLLTARSDAAHLRGGLVEQKRD